MRMSIAFIALVLAATTCAGATTYLVKPDRTGDYATTETALSAAVDGGIVELADGTFTGEGNRNIALFGKNVTLHSQSGDPATCIIDLEGGEGMRFS